MNVPANIWFNELVEDLKDIITERVFNSRQELIVGYHEIGKRILVEKENAERDGVTVEGLVQGVAEAMGRSERTIWYAVQFVNAYPDMDALPDGKNLSWWKIVNQLLPKHKKDKIESEESECLHKKVKCMKCKKVLEYEQWKV